ncbi:MAG: dTDP-4-dehydrorhamnose 3,5-epimerase family protein [Bacteroidetes bacterium]|nr:dTDP-4-dehydrorhamnose 3,5-epimerase family protein [Bacteroidota bacterium]MBS1740565.1 dTDP-4-dehydrorhamnose 3,5-epimerase family protein [Bacteroidota bacterium]
MNIEKLVNGAALIEFPSFFDHRGSFVKAFHNSSLVNAGIHFQLKESYFSYSQKDVIRGMHFQLPPHQHAKIVFCPQGAILDVIVDLRKQSPTFKQCLAQVLSQENHKAFYIPEGFAHGFKALTENALTYYLVSSEYDNLSDTGVRFDSIEFDWQVEQPILSTRDLSFVSLEEFQSPF